MGLPLPLPPLRRYRREDLGSDLAAAAAVAFLTVPQAMAYATIAGLPPVVGLYAAGLPTIVGSIFRSSSHVLAGPTNAVSLLVGAAVLATSHLEPTTMVLTLALMVGLFQLTAGLLKLGSIVHYISNAVVLGYITGAAVLIGLGQLHNCTGSPGASGRIWVTLEAFVAGLPAWEPIALAMSLGTIAFIVGVRRFNASSGRSLPGAVLALLLGIVLTRSFDLDARGLAVVADLSAIPGGTIPFTLPDLGVVGELWPVAVACTVLSLVEASAVARSIASRTGQRIDSSTEFVGQGLATVRGAFAGGYPGGGSLSRSALNERAGARTRLAGIVTGALMLVILLAVGPALDATPIASLAGLLLVIAWDLVDFDKIGRIVRTSRGDALAFFGTTIGTWTLPLDDAIYLGVAISLVLFLRRARAITIVELVVDEHSRLREFRHAEDHEFAQRCPHVNFLHVEGSLAFFAGGELQNALTERIADPELRVLVLRLKRAHGLDATTAGVLEASARILREQGRYLVLAGMTEDQMGVLERSGVAEAMGREHLFPTRARWFEALNAARAHAFTLAGQSCDTCPLAEWGRGVESAHIAQIQSEKQAD